MVKSLPASAGDVVRSLGGEEIPLGGGNGNPPIGHSPCCKESDMTEGSGTAFIYVLFFNNLAYPHSSLAPRRVMVNC